MLRKFFTSIPGLFSFSSLVKWSNPSIIAPFYHLISDNVPLHNKHLYPVVKTANFIKDLDFMFKHFIPVDVMDIPFILSGEKQLNKPGLFLSFDDGFRELSTIVAPILQKKGIPATFFVNPAFVDNSDMLYRGKVSLITEKIYGLGNSFVAPGFIIPIWGNEAKKPKTFLKNLFALRYNDTPLIERIAKELNVDWKDYLKQVNPYLTVDELKELAGKGFIIGAHGLNHIKFSDLSPLMQIENVLKSIEWVQENIPSQPRVFAFPFTNYGVSDEFYRFFFVDNQQLFDTMFGTAGIKSSLSDKLLHRIPMEIDGRDAAQILGGELLYYMAKKFFGKHRETFLQ